MPYRKFYAGLAILLLVGCSDHKKKNNASKKTDSLSYFFERSYNDSLPINIKKSFTERARRIISTQPNDSMNRVYHFKLANRYLYLYDLENYKKTSEKIISASKAANDSISLAKAYSYLADYYSWQFTSDSAYQNYFRAEKIYLNLHNYKKLTECLFNKCTILFNEKDYIGSEKSAFETLKILKIKPDTQMSYQIYNLLGIIYNELNEFPKALEYHKKALSMMEHETQKAKSFLIPSSLNNIGLVYQNSKNHKKAIHYFEKGLQVKNLKFTSPLVYIHLKNNLGYSKLEIGDYSNMPEMFNETLKLSDSIKLITGSIPSKIYLSDFYAIKKDTVKAMYYLSNAYRLSKKSGIQRDILLSLKELAKIDSKKSRFYSTEYIRINDSLQLAERKIRNKLARIEFETDEIITQKNQLVEQRKILIYIALSIILIGILIFIIRFQSSKNRELKLVQQQQKANEEIYRLMLTQQQKLEEGKQLEKKRISQELHDGVMGKLTGIRLNLFVLSRKDDQETIQKCLSHIDELKTLEQEIRDISHDLNREKTAVSSNFSLMVFSFIEIQKKICQAEITFSVTPEIQWNAVDNIAKINLYRILQESFQNINKYANAKNVEVNFYKKDNSIILEIKDDGVGFNLNRRKKGIGLLNMESRIKDSNGKIEVITTPGKGTLLKFELPLKTA